MFSFSILEMYSVSPLAYELGIKKTVSFARC